MARSCSKAPTASWCRAASAPAARAGMMKAAQIARERGIPYFGICYGFQWAAVEYARGVCGLVGGRLHRMLARHAEHKLIYKLRDLLGVDDLGGTMRLGQYECVLAPGSLGQKIYGASNDLRAAPPSLRVQLPLRADAHRQGPAHLGQIARRQVRRDDRAAGPSLVRGRAVPSGVQVEAASPASAVRQLHRSQPPAQDSVGAERPAEAGIA